MTRLLHKNVLFHFDNDCNKSFEEIKLVLISEPILAYPYFEKPFILHVTQVHLAYATKILNYLKITSSFCMDC